MRRSITIALLLGSVLGTTAEARSVSYPAAQTCPAATDSPLHDATLQQQIAHTANGDIAYYRFGHGSPIVLQTGFRASLDEWNAAFLAGLAQHHEVIVFDNRGIGRSMPDASRFTVHDMASDAVALIESLQLKDVTLVGWSMGSAISAQVAIDHPDAVRRIVLMNPTAPGPRGVPVPADVSATLSGTKPNTTFDDVMAVLFPRAALPLAEHCFRAAMFVPSDYKAPVVSASVTAGQAGLLQAWSQDATAARALRNVTLPTLVLGGADDQVLPKRNAEALAGTMPHARLLMVRAAGHAMMYQYPHQLAAAIDGFIAQTSRASTPA